MISVTLVLILVLVLGILPNSLNIIAVSGIIVSLLVKFNKLFNKAVIWYIAFFILGVLTMIFYREPYLRLMTGGMIGYGFFLIVMFVGVLPNKWSVSRIIKKNRGVFSILGFLAITPHAMLHILGIYSTIDLYGIAAYVLMIPLTFISFRVIRKEIPVKDWFTIQKGAYVIYIALFAHLLVVSSWQNKVVYAVLLTLYVNNKLLKEYRK
jgi:DMSO/TMAO reductase YedYZ heme-binding membrane subunit